MARGSVPTRWPCGFLPRFEHGAGTNLHGPLFAGPAGRTVVIKLADGTDGAEETYRLTGNAAMEVGKGAISGVEKSAKVTVCHTEQAGHRVAHFFKRAIWQVAE